MKTMQTNRQFRKDFFFFRRDSSGVLSLSVELELLASLPVGASRASDGLGEAVALAETARSLAGRGEAAQLAVLHHRVAYPVDLRVAANGLVHRIDEDHLDHQPHNQPIEPYYHYLSIINMPSLPRRICKWSPSRPSRS